MPHAVRMFALLSFGSLAFGLVAIAVVLPGLLPFPVSDLGWLGGLTLVGPTVLASSILPAVLVWLAAWKRQSWARVILAGLYVFGVVTTLLNLALSPPNIPGGITFLVVFTTQAALQGLALALVCSPSARPWFAKPPP